MSNPLTETRRLDDGAHIRELRQRVEQSPLNELYRFSLAKALFDSGNWQDCVCHLDEALKINPEWMAATTLKGRALQAAGDLSGARKFFARAVVLATAQGHETARDEILQMMESLGA